MEVQIHPSWKAALKQEFSKLYFDEIVLFLKTERALDKKIYPPGSLIFNAFNLTPFEDVKVVILGQDPYHGYNQAHGLSFSVLKGTKPPPSLRNMYKEIKNDIGIAMPANYGDLTAWAKQGVFLLNTSLTVRDGEPNSHAQIGWQTFTDAVITALSDKREGLIFLLWGKFAQQKQALIDETKHHVLKAAHPSPFSAERGFMGCKHFSKTHEWLMSENKQPIDWIITDPDE